MPKKKAPIRMCVDRILRPEKKIEWSKLSIAENPVNQPPARNMLLGASRHPMKLALETGKKWADGKTLGVYFMNGTPFQIAKVKEIANEWRRYAEIGFNFSATKKAAQIRIAFKFNDDTSSWSWIGNEALKVSNDEPTMNFGWLDENTEDEEWRRVVLHEFGHALGCIHEHQNPKGGIKWNEQAVYNYFAGSPNFWTKAETDVNVLQKYSLTQLNASAFDPDSIMLYSFDGALIVGGKGTKFNTKLSSGDKEFVNTQYPVLDFVSATLEGVGQYAGKAYFFEGNQYFRFDWKNDEIDYGYPLGLNGWKLTGNFLTGIDAALNGEVQYAGKAYFFKGTQYTRYDWKNDSLDAGFPAALSAWKLPAAFASGVDAATNGRLKYAGKAYFFRGNKYARYDWATDKVDLSGALSAWNLPGDFANGIDAALNGSGAYAGKLYFFKGNQYVRYDWKTEKVDAGYPMPIAGNWI